MIDEFQIRPAHNVLPGTIVHTDGVIFSTVFRDCDSCGLILYHLSDGRSYTIPFKDEYRYGSLYSVKAEGLAPSEWGYRYYRDDYSFEDPYARELTSLKTKDGTINVCRLFPVPEDALPAYGGRKTGEWADTLIYCMHVKGFTASRSSKVHKKGTFLGVVEKIPYLKELGITAVELLPIYELREESLGMVLEKKAAEEDVPAKLPMHLPLKTESGEEKVNYWNFGEGCYFAPKKAYAGKTGPQQEFSDMVNALHAAGIEVYLQLFFPDSVSVQTQLETARFYVTHYGVDGFHLKGTESAVRTLATDPMLSDTRIFYYTFPYEKLQKIDAENPTTGKPSIHQLSEYTDHFQTLVRKVVKSDDQVLREFVKIFLTVPKEHGRVHYAANYEGFTLNDLVSFNWKHNEANGEENKDGCDDNLSWNCGVEGKSMKRDIRALRMRQLKNFMTLNLLAQGTPLLYAGDEFMNSQEGNNNPYCQDNETGWTNWKDTKDAGELLSFTKKMIAFRKEHGIFRRRTPFRFSDYKVSGYPDVSFHGADAWKPDLGGYSHTVGILFDENYSETDPKASLLYLAINMHWHNRQLGIPTPPAGYVWRVLMDTSEDHSFPADPERISDQRHVQVRGRTIMILQAVKEEKEMPAGKRADEALRKAAAPAAEDPGKAAAPADEEPGKVPAAADVKAEEKKDAAEESTKHEGKDHRPKDVTAF